MPCVSGDAFFLNFQELTTMWEMTTNELRPCPFCKSDELTETNGQKIHCKQCHASTPLEMWNHRPLEDRLVASALKLTVRKGHMAFNAEAP
jgi:hypothetical protein